jgi:hypothetical protein
MSNVYKNAIYKPTTTAGTTVYTCNATARAVIQNIQLTTTLEISHVSLSSDATENAAKGPIILEEGDALIISCNNTSITGIVSILEVNRGSLTS